MSNLRRGISRRLEASEEHQVSKNRRVVKHLFYATVLGGVFGMALVSSPAALADRGHRAKGIYHRVIELEAKEEIRATLHAFVAALNSTFVSGATDPLGPIAPVLHPDIELYATPPPTPSDPMPMPMVFIGRDQVVGGYGQGVVASTRPNILASAMDVRLSTKAMAVADLRFANSVNFPAACMLGSPGCAQVMLFADVHVTFELSAQDVWQVTSVDLVHHLAHGGSPPMSP